MSPPSIDDFINGAKITLHFPPDELRLVIGTEYDYYTGVKMAPPLTFYMDYRFCMPEKLVIGTESTTLTTFP